MPIIFLLNTNIENNVPVYTLILKSIIYYYIFYLGLIYNFNLIILKNIEKLI